MKLGGKGKNVDTFVDQLKSEGEKVSSQQEASQKPKSRAKSPDAPTERSAVFFPCWWFEKLLYWVINTITTDGIVLQ